MPSIDSAPLYLMQLSIINLTSASNSDILRYWDPIFDRIVERSIGWTISLK